MYDELVKRLRICPDYNDGCVNCPHEHDLSCRTTTMHEAADAIVELSDKLAVAEEGKIKLFCQIPRWIPVAERLPDQSQENMYICLIVGGEYDQLSWYDLCDFAEGQFWIQDDLRKSHVTHWMPLPEPPKEG